MFDLTTLKKAWALLDAFERRNAIKILIIAVLSAFASTAMVGSVIPFLSVLSDPAKIWEIPHLAWAYDQFGFTSSYDFLVALGLGALVIIVLSMIVQVLKVYAMARFSMMRMHSLSYRLLARYLGQPYEYFLDHHSGEMGTRLLDEAQQVVNRFLRPMAELIAATLTVTALVVFLLWVEPLVALASFSVFGGVYGATYALTRRRLRQLGQARVTSNAERYRLATEALGGIKDIKLLGRERAYVDRFRGPSYQMVDAQIRMELLSQIPTHMIHGVAFGGVVLLCLVLLEPEAFNEGTGLGAILPILGVFAFAAQRMMPELSRLYRSAAQIQAGKAAVDAIHADLIGDPAALPRQPPEGLGLKQRLRLDGISYRYPKAEHAGINNITLTIHAGEKIGIIGSTGAGKTTLADIILGLLSPYEGQLIVDDRPITKGNLRAWQQTVGYVPQEIFLTDASIAENIALGIAPNEIDNYRVVQAASIAKIEAFVRQELPNGFATNVGERGVRLSGGQRQRIGIARALYHDADLIVFDEATSALDNLTESDVMTAINALPGDKTVLIIAHRLSTVQHCDRIVVMEQGSVVGFDNWEALTKDNTSFQSIAKLSDST
jgi:ABC-type multidrug transport system fused ATPase/permease subunit